MSNLHYPWTYAFFNLRCLHQSTSVFVLVFNKQFYDEAGLIVYIVVFRRSFYKYLYEYM